jgi:hypothetical protein
MYRVAAWFLSVCAALALAGTVSAQGKFGEQAPDFPAGAFTDGNQYKLSDFQGKVVVLYFFEHG